MKTEPTEPRTAKIQEVRLEMRDFGKRLKLALEKKGLTQSDLCRQIWGDSLDSRGVKVAKNRDRMSQYIAGKGYPNLENLKLIADALGVKSEDLAPAVIQGDVEREDRAQVQMTGVSGALHKSFLRINVMTSTELATKIVNMLAADPIVNEGLARKVTLEPEVQNPAKKKDRVVKL